MSSKESFMGREVVRNSPARFVRGDPVSSTPSPTEIEIAEPSDLLRDQTAAVQEARRRTPLTRTRIYKKFQR